LTNGKDKGRVELCGAWRFHRIPALWKGASMKSDGFAYWQANWAARPLSVGDVAQQTKE